MTQKLQINVLNLIKMCWKSVHAQKFCSTRKVPVQVVHFVCSSTTSILEKPMLTHICMFRSYGDLFVWNIQNFLEELEVSSGADAFLFRCCWLCCLWTLLHALDKNMLSCVDMYIHSWRKNWKAMKTELSINILGFPKGISSIPLERLHNLPTHLFLPIPSPLNILSTWWPFYFYYVAQAEHDEHTDSDDKNHADMHRCNLLMLLGRILLVSPHHSTCNISLNILFALQQILNCL